MSAENLGEVTAGAVQCKQSGLDFAFSILAIPAILAILAISSDPCSSAVRFSALPHRHTQPPHPGLLYSHQLFPYIESIH